MDVPCQDAGLLNATMTHLKSDNGKLGKKGAREVYQDLDTLKSALKGKAR